MNDPALETLFLPFEKGLLTWPEQGPALFLRARAGAAIPDAAKASLLCRQSFRPWAAALEQAGFAVAATEAPPEQPCPLVLLLPPRQREEARALMARAVLAAAPGGRIVASLANSEGARTAEADLALLAGPVESLSKHKCRVFWATRPAALDRDLLAQWQALDAPRPIAGGRFVSRPGLFAWDRIDAGSALLAACLPATLAGEGADLGAGFGYLATEVLARCPAVTALDLYEAEQRGLDLARENLAAARATLGFFWHDVTSGLPRSYDFIVSNPPFHQGRADRADLGQGFIRAAAAGLKPGGRLCLVANRHLPYEETLKGAFRKVAVLAEDGAYKVIEAIKAGR